MGLGKPRTFQVVCFFEKLIYYFITSTVKVWGKKPDLWPDYFRPENHFLPVL